MREMAYVFEKRQKYLGNDVDLWEICVEMAYVLTKSLKMCKMTQRFGKWPKYMGNGIDTQDTA